jgi:hypothetical protein
MPHHQRLLAAFAATLGLLAPAAAQNVGAGEGDRTFIEQQEKSADAAAPEVAAARGRPSERFKVAGGYLHQFNTSLNTGGHYAADRVFAAFSSRMLLTPNMDLDIGLAWEFDHYRFSGTALGLGSSLSTNSLSVVPRFTVLLDQHWAINAAPLLQLSGENDAEAGDTITGGAIAGFRYAFDQDHVLGAGVLVKGLLGSGVLVVPVPLVDWEITEGLRLSNIRAPEANPFVGLELEQELGREFDLGLGVAWMFRQARLDDSGANANQIFQEMNLAVYARAEWKPTSNFRLDLVVGTAAYSRLKTLTGGGDTITSTGANASLMVGAFASYRF